MASRFFFNGRLYTTPVAASRVDDTQMAPRNPAVGNNLAVVGTADAGQPNVPLVFSSPREAQLELKGGELLTAVRKAFAPSSATGGPIKVYAVRVGTATQSALTLKDGSGNDVITLASTVYGVYANQIRVLIEAGTDVGRKVTTRLIDQYYTADNLAKKAFVLRYTGADTVGTFELTPTTLTLKSGASSPGSTTNAITLSDFPTVAQLCDRINTVTGWSAVVDPGAELHPTSRALDGVAAATDAKTANVQITANLQAIINWINSNAEGFVTATRPLAAAAMPAVTTGYVYMSGATNPAVVNNDWLNAFGALEEADVQHVVALNGSATVHDYLDAHCVFMSDAGRKERRGYTGPDWGISKADVISKARGLASHRTALVWPGHYDNDLERNRGQHPPYMTAVHVAGGFSGMNPGYAMTNKSIRVVGLETNPTTPGDTDDLIMGGVCCVQEGPRGIKVVRSISTWLDNDNFNKVEISCGLATDFTVRAVREALEPLIGNKASPQILATAAQITESVLKRLAQPEPAGLGVIVGDANSPAYKDIQCEIDGDILYVSFQCSPVVPLNFIGLTVSIVPYRGSIRLGA
jgi:hypothetical protein